jgi:hypothetical protein
MKPRGASGQPMKGQRNVEIRPKARKVPTKHISTDCPLEQFDRLKRERDEALEQLAATSEVLKVISSSPGELKRVFESMLENAFASVRPALAIYCSTKMMRSDTLLYITRHRLGLPNSNAIRLPLVI